MFCMNTNEDKEYRSYKGISQKIFCVKTSRKRFFVILEIECMNAACPLLLFAMAILTCNTHDRGKIFELKFGFSKKATRRQNLPAQTSKQSLDILSNVCVLLRKPKQYF